MRHVIRLAVLLAAILPTGALAQSGSDPTGTSQPPDTGGSASLPDSNGSGVQTDSDLPTTAPAAPRGATSETDVASEDRVKSVQHKPFIKEGRFEVTPLGFLTLNDAFFPKYGPALRIAYHVHDSLAFGLRASQYNLIPSDNVRLAKRELQARVPTVQPKSAFALDVIWSPIYGKVSVFNAIQHFDLYVVGGLGAVRSQTSPTDGMHLSSHLGIGQRFSLTDFMTVDLSLLETLYSDRPGDGNRVQLMHGLSVQAGLGFFLPFTFDREP